MNAGFYSYDRKVEHVILRQLSVNGMMQL